jgi:hypothetical protein
MAIGKASTCHPERRKDKKEGGVKLQFQTLIAKKSGTRINEDATWLWAKPLPATQREERIRKKREVEPVREVDSKKGVEQE